jgi:hypothetical protein
MGLLSQGETPPIRLKQVHQNRGEQDHEYDADTQARRRLDDMCRPNMPDQTGEGQQAEDKEQQSKHEGWTNA